jgi:choline dehydrogenase-like flavoprotein
MFIDFRELDDGTAIEADVCIVGAGAAGITFARTLIGAGLEVALLESGGLEPDAAIQALYEAQAVRMTGDRHPRAASK